MVVAYAARRRPHRLRPPGNRRSRNAERCRRGSGFARFASALSGELLNLLALTAAGAEVARVLPWSPPTAGPTAVARKLIRRRKEATMDGDVAYRDGARALVHRWRDFGRVNGSMSCRTARRSRSQSCAAEAGRWTESC